MLSGKQARLEKESEGFSCEVWIFFIVRILLYVIYIIKIILKNKCVRGKFMFNVLFSDSIPRLKVREDLNSQWDSTQFHEIHSQEKGAKWSWWSLVILFFFSDSFVRSCVFPGDVLLMTHGLHLISQALSVPCWDFPCLPRCCFPLLYKATILYHCQFVTFTTAADQTLMGGQFSFLAVILPARPLG